MEHTILPNDQQAKYKMPLLFDYFSVGGPSDLLHALTSVGDALLVATSSGVYKIQGTDVPNSTTLILDLRSQMGHVTSIVGGQDGRIYVGYLQGLKVARHGIVECDIRSGELTGCGCHSRLLADGSIALLDIGTLNLFTCRPVEEGQWVIACDIESKFDWVDIEGYNYIHQHGVFRAAVDVRLDYPCVLTGEDIDLDMIEQRWCAKSDHSHSIASMTVLHGDIYHINWDGTTLYRNFKHHFQLPDGDYPHQVISNGTDLFIMYDHEVKRLWMNPIWSPRIHHLVCIKHRVGIRTVFTLRSCGHPLLCSLPEEMLAEVFNWVIK